MELGREVVVDWRDGTVRAWRPAPLADHAVTLSTSTVRATERAAADLRTVELGVPTGFGAVARLLLRAEGVASSRIEDISAPTWEVVRAESTRELLAPVAAAAHVADNLSAVEAGLDHAVGGRPLSAADLLEWHRALMVHGTLPDRLVGAWRREVGWIGGQDPRSAVFVPAPHEDIPELMDELVAVANARPWDPVTTAAMVHAQFETIHPFGDGNGRVGRVLAIWVLVRHLELSLGPPFSAAIARDVGGYLAALGAFRIGAHDQLVAWFAGVLRSSARASARWALDLGDVVAAWERATAHLRRDSTAVRLLPLVARMPVLSAGHVADELHVAPQTARRALDELAALGVLEVEAPVASGPGRPRRWWRATTVLEALDSWQP